MHEISEEKKPEIEIPQETPEEKFSQRNSLLNSVENSHPEQMPLPTLGNEISIENSPPSLETMDNTSWGNGKEEISQNYQQISPKLESPRNEGKEEEDPRELSFRFSETFHQNSPQLDHNFEVKSEVITIDNNHIHNNMDDHNLLHPLQTQSLETNNEGPCDSQDTFVFDPSE